MVRGLVYSIFAVILALLLAMIVFASGGADGDGVLISGWTLLIALFLVAPAAFGIGYWHHLKRHPKEPHWDAELGQ